MLGQAAAHAHGIRMLFGEGGKRRRRAVDVCQQGSDSVPGQQHKG
jgi:hypothetical protein